jgi:prepilin-type N-terminal cleavage/methylation domain-containing protein
MPPRPADGFTLIEMLLVISIIVVLAGLAFPAFTMVQRQLDNTRTATTVQLCSQAIEQWRSINGSYPDRTPAYAPTDRLPSGLDQAATFGKFGTSTSNQGDPVQQWLMVVHLLRKMDPANWTQVPKDRWQQDLRYVPARHYPDQPDRMPNPDSFILWSRGRNMKDDPFLYDIQPGDPLVPVPFGGSNRDINPSTGKPGDDLSNIVR